MCGLKRVDGVVRLEEHLVTPSRVCGLKHPDLQAHKARVGVTPSRVCGLKRLVRHAQYEDEGRHTLTGVWIETSGPSAGWTSRTCHTLTGVWIETIIASAMDGIGVVTPSRVCGLKQPDLHPHIDNPGVTPSRVCGLKQP